MWVRFILLCFAVNTVYASDSIPQERLPVSLEVGRIYFQSLDLSM